MKLYDSFEGYGSVFVCGDIHGEFKSLLFELERKGVTDSIVILAGDCGIGFEKPAYYEQLYRKLATRLDKINCQLLMLRGNHDDPEYFDKGLIDFPRMKTIPDYSVVQFGGRNILCVGGAISVDRKHRLDAMLQAAMKGRTAPKYYWDNETPVYDDEALAGLKASGICIDTVVSHTAPSFCKPISKAGIACWLQGDKQLSEDTFAERQTMDRIYDRLIADGHPVSGWFYGHFHDSNTEFISDIRYSMLNILELKEVVY